MIVDTTNAIDSLLVPVNPADSDKICMVDRTISCNSSKADARISISSQYKDPHIPSSQPMSQACATYSLNIKKCLTKKKVSCDKSPLCINKSKTNTIITCSSAGLEVVRAYFDTIQGKYNINRSVKYDASKAAESICMKFFDLPSSPKRKNIVEKANFTVNLYLTTSKVLINGKKLAQFNNCVLPELILYVNQHYKANMDMILKDKIISSLDNMGDADNTTSISEEVLGSDTTRSSTKSHYSECSASSGMSMVDIVPSLEIENVGILALEDSGVPCHPNEVAQVELEQLPTSLNSPPYDDDGKDELLNSVSNIILTDSSSTCDLDESVTHCDMLDHTKCDLDHTKCDRGPLNIEKSKVNTIITCSSAGLEVVRAYFDSTQTPSPVYSSLIHSMSGVQHPSIEQNDDDDPSIEQNDDDDDLIRVYNIILDYWLNSQVIPSDLHTSMSVSSEEQDDDEEDVDVVIEDGLSMDVKTPKMLKKYRICSAKLSKKKQTSSPGISIFNKKIDDIQEILASMNEQFVKSTDKFSESEAKMNLRCNELEKAIANTNKKLTGRLSGVVSELEAIKGSQAGTSQEIIPLNKAEISKEIISDVINDSIITIENEITTLRKEVSNIRSNIYSEKSKLVNEVVTDSLITIDNNIKYKFDNELLDTSTQIKLMDERISSQNNFIQSLQRQLATVSCRMDEFSSNTQVSDSTNYYSHHMKQPKTPTNLRKNKKRFDPTQHHFDPSSHHLFRGGRDPLSNMYTHCNCKKMYFAC